jgi:capsular exopolysaccharide synthesis family protein
MGKYFEALEQADRERALREQARRDGASLSIAPVAVRPSREAPPVQPRPARETSEPANGSVGFERPTTQKALANRQPVRDMPVESGARVVEEHLVSLLAPTSFEAEQYRAVRHKMEQLHRTATLTIVGVSSPEAGDGKTMTAINLAGALAQASDARVLIVDADVRRSSIAERVGLDSSHGSGLIGAILDPRLSLNDVVEPCPPFNLSIVRAGQQSSAPYEVLKSPRLGQLLNEARQQYDYIIVDMPPLVPMPDCRLIGRWVDGFLIVVTAHKTRRRLLEEAVKVLDPKTIVGLIFNGDDEARTRYAKGSGWSSGADRDGWRLPFRRRSMLEGS